MMGRHALRGLRMAMPRVGDRAPDFELQATDGSLVRLDEQRGRKVVLFFYPRDDTPGCTREACGFRDRMSEIAERGTAVFGVSDDPVESHELFSSKFSLNYPLLADVEHQAIEAYGLWVEKRMAGRTFMGTQRATFLIDEDGMVSAVWPNVKPDDHAEEVVQALDA